MELTLSSHITYLKSSLQITGSKSETNRLLLLQALYPDISIENESVSDDARAMQHGLQITRGIVDIHHAGTAMRFLTAFFASQPGREVVLTGSARMKERPIRILVDALRQLGAEITYTDRDGYPPLKIKGKELKKSKISVAADISSQYISALLLIAPKLENGLELSLEGVLTSVPYIKMTLALLEKLGVNTSFNQNVIRVEAMEKISKPKKLVVESDWSSASYYYSLVAMADEGSEVILGSYTPDSLQGDSVLQQLYTDFGVHTSFVDNKLVLKKTSFKPDTAVKFNLIHAPDIAQTIAVTCFGLGMGCSLSGLHTLKIKETDRLEALKTELTKLGADIRVTEKELYLQPASYINSRIAIDTYNDHRMAMAFAPLGLKTKLIIKDAGVVSKSYPGFWDDMKRLGFEIEISGGNNI